MVCTKNTYLTGELVDHSGKPATVLRIKQFEIGGSGYARRIKDEEWAQHRDAINQLETEGCSRRDILRALHANYGFFPTYGQLNTKMTQWQRCPTGDDLPQVQNSSVEKTPSNLMHRLLIMDVDSQTSFPIDSSFTGVPISDDLGIMLSASDSDGKRTASALGTEVTATLPSISEQQPEPSDLSEIDKMSICSNGSSDFKHFSRYATALRDEPAATCYKSRAYYSSNSSHSSWGFEEVTGFPAVETPGFDTQHPFRRIRSGVVLGAQPGQTVNRSSRKPRTVIIHQASGASYDCRRTADMCSSRWR